MAEQMRQAVFFNTIGGARSGCGCTTRECKFIPMSFNVVKTNNFYYNPGGRASWARRSKSGGGQNWGRKVATKIGINRLGGPV